VSEDDSDYRLRNRQKLTRETNYKHEHVAGKSYVPKSTISVPIFTHKKATKKVLAIFDWMYKGEENSGKFLDVNYTGALWNNVLAQCEQRGVVANWIAVTVRRDADIKKLIAKVQPDHVLFLGFDHFANLLPSRYSELMTRLPGCFRGRIFKHEKGYTFSSTFSWKYIADLNEKIYATTANMLDLFVNDIEHCLGEDNRYTLPQASDIQSIIIRNMNEWKNLYQRIIKAKVVSVDTETESLNRVKDNRILTVHFSLNKKISYCLPLYHKDSPFKGSEIEIIKADLAEWLQNGESRFLIFQNAKFDIIMFRRDLNIKYINHRIWDISSAEFCLSENRKWLAQARVTLTGKDIYTLEHLALNYGGEAYLEGDVSKSDRSRMAELDLDKIAIYAGKDTVYPYCIAQFQLQEATRRGSNYDKFELTVTELCSDMTLVFADMETNGALVDSAYIRQLLMPNSKFMQMIDELRRSFKDFKSAKRANKILLEKTGKNYKTGLFGDIAEGWVFDINKDEHLQLLFFEILQLKIVDYKKIKGGKLDKKFVSEYEGTVPEVARLAEHRKLKTLLNTYIKGINKFLLEEPDCFDSRLRASYSFLFILTLRCSASRPSLQNIPSRGKNAKIIKREFIAPPNKILLKGDFNAHEVRGWGNISKDKNIAKSFQPGIEIRRKLRILFNQDDEKHSAILEYMDRIKWKEITDPEEKLKLAKKSNFPDELKLILELESRGDIHRMNYERFFGVPANQVNDEQRQSVKEVAFGTLYGKSAPGLAATVFKKELKKIAKAYGEDSEEYTNALFTYTAKAQKLINVMFDNFAEGKKWIDKQNEDGAATLENVSIFGAVRHLSGYLHTEKQIHGRMNRRGPNTLIQGPSSNIGFTGARLMQKIDYALSKRGINLGWIHSNVVHDSLENESRIDMLPLTAYYIEHCMTTLSYKRIRDTYGFDMPIQMEFDLEIGGSLANMVKYDYSRTSMLNGVEKSLSWMEQELKYEIPKKKYLKAVEYNFDIIWPYRLKELEQMSGSKSSDVMLLKPKIAATLDWKTVNAT
jgi:DNA polymerase I-like protein with 3'-5' exonuclease and polymerase domains